MKYLELFRLGIEHAFYSDRRCADFAIVPSRATESLLRNHRALARPTRSGLRVLASATEEKETAIPFAEGTRLVFEMRLTNGDFPLFTELGEYKSRAAPVYFGTDSLRLSLGSRSARHRDRLAVVEPAAAEDFVLSQAPVHGLDTSNFRLSGEDPVPSVTGFDAEGRLLSVDTSNARPGQAFAVEYAVPPRRPRGLFAEIEIELDGSLVNLRRPAAPAPEYVVGFEAKKARWAYYCVTDRSDDMARYRVIDVPPGNGDEPLEFAEDGKKDLVVDPDPSDRLAQQLADQYPEARRFRFLSSAPVTCRDRPRKGLRLQLGGETLPGPLANPSFRNFGTIEFATDGSDTKSKQDCLTEVVKLMTGAQV